MDWPMVGAIAVTAVTAIAFLLILGGFDAILDNPRRMKKERQSGYDEAVRDIMRCHEYYDREKDEYRHIEIMVQDGKPTIEWCERFARWFDAGEACAIDSFVLSGVMNKRTGEKFKRRFRAQAEEIIRKKIEQDVAA